MKLVLYLLFSIIFLGGVLAMPQSSLLRFYELNGSIVDSVAAANGVNDGADYVSLFYGQGLDYVSANTDNVSIPYIPQGNTLSLSFMANFDDVSGTENLFRTGAGNYIQIYKDNTRVTAYFKGADCTTPMYVEGALSSFSAGTNYLITVVFNLTASGSGDKIKIYRDTTLVSGSETGSQTLICNSSVRSEIGTAANPYDGKIDQFAIFRQPLTIENITWLYNGGAFRSYNDFSGGPVPPDYFTIRLNDNYGNAISVFNVSFNGSSYSTTSGVVNTSFFNNLSQVFNFSFMSPNFFSSQNLSFNVSADLTGSVYQSIVSVQGFKKVSGAALDNFTVNDSSVSSSTTSGVAVINLLNGSSQVLSFISPDGFYNKTFLVNVSPLDNISVNVSGLYDSVVRVFGFNYSSNTGLPGLNGSVVYNSFSESFSAAGDNATVNLTSGLDYTFYINSSKRYVYGDRYNSKVVSVTPSLVFNFTLPHSQSVFISALDTLTGASLDGVSAAFYGTSVYNYTFNDSLYRFPLNVGSYDLLVQKDSYTNVGRLVSIEAGKLTNLTVLMANVSESVVFTVQNVYQSVLPGARIIITRASDGAVAIDTITDITGQAAFDLSSLLNYEINISLSGYQDLVGSYSVADTTPVFTLQVDTGGVDYLAGLYASFSPVGVVPLNNGSVYNFSFNVSSSVFPLTGCWFSVYGNETYLLSFNQSFCDSDSGFVVSALDTGNYSSFYLLGVVELNSTVNMSFIQRYSVSSVYEGEASLAVFLRNLKGFDKAGFSAFGRGLLMLVFIVMLVGSLTGESFNIAGSEGNKVLLVVWGLVGFFSAAGWLTIAQVPVAGDWLVFIFVSLLTIGWIVWKEVY